VANKPKFLEAWPQKDNVFENNYPQQHVVGWLKFIEIHDCGWIAHDVSITNHL
jgi:hypothetical protein